MMGVNESENYQREEKDAEAVKVKRKGNGRKLKRCGGGGALPQYRLVQLHGGEKEDGVRRKGGRRG